MFLLWVNSACTACFPHCPPAGSLEWETGRVHGWELTQTGQFQRCHCSTLKSGKKNRMRALTSAEAISQRLGEHQACLGEMVSGLCITWVFFFFISLLKLLLPQPSEYPSDCLTLSHWGRRKEWQWRHFAAGWGHSPQSHTLWGEGSLLAEGCTCLAVQQLQR